FYGFPQALFDFDYPAPGDPDLAHEIAEVVKPHWIGLDGDQWGLDHGTWSVLAHVFPHADIPVVQLSINALKPLAYHVELAAKLDALRNKGVMIVASGNVVHNLGELQWEQRDLAFDWASRFDDAVVEQLARAPGDILRIQEHPDYKLAVPTPDHFIPLLYLVGLAAVDGADPEPLVSNPNTIRTSPQRCFRPSAKCLASRSRPTPCWPPGAKPTGCLPTSSSQLRCKRTNARRPRESRAAIRRCGKTRPDLRDVFPRHAIRDLEHRIAVQSATSPESNYDYGRGHRAAGAYLLRKGAG
ncbi:MAG: dioxygenase, partial [Alphaproteobacteria bacterium]